MRPVKFLVPIGGLLLLAGCGGTLPKASTADPAAVRAMLQAKVDSGELPTLDLTTSVTGTDADHNGVRDDIDGLIAKQPAVSGQMAALTQVAQSIQATLTLDTKDPAAVAAVATSMSKAVACLFTQYDGPTAAGQFHWLQEMSINTMPRLQAYDLFNIAMNNSVNPLATGSVCNA